MKMHDTAVRERGPLPSKRQALARLAKLALMASQSAAKSARFLLDQLSMTATMSSVLLDLTPKIQTSQTQPAKNAA